MTSKQEITSGDKIMENSEVQTKFFQLYSAAKSKHQHYAPFMIQSKRFRQSKQNNQIPAIGTYNLRSCFQRRTSPFQDKMSQIFQQCETKKQQMSIFKSSCSRFDKIKKQIPGPASYNLFNAANNQKSSEFKKKLIKETKLNDLTKACPSIPFKDNRFGYSLANGKFKSIEKGLQQLQFEKQSRKQYAQTLDGQLHFKRQRESLANSQVDFKRKLNQSTSKIVNRENLSPNLSEKSISLAKKPKFQHLYHSKGVPVVQNHKLLGPGQYEIKSNHFEKYTKNQRFQFFGSSEVRFKHKQDNQIKGYTLIQMIKQNKKLMKIQRKSTKKISLNKSQERFNYKKLTYPGPGAYDPKDSLKKIGRGNTFFPQSERFKQLYPEKEQFDEPQKIEDSQAQRKTVQTGSLKKQRFKPMHNVYQPVKTTQIRGILSNNKNLINRQGISKQAIYQSQQIKSWSQQQNRNKVEKKGYIKQLKEQLQRMSRTPQAEGQIRSQIKKMRQMSDKKGIQDQ